MTTPTKEQIKRILDVVPVEDGEFILDEVIAEWEKIKEEEHKIITQKDSHSYPLCEKCARDCSNRFYDTTKGCGFFKEKIRS